MDGTKLGDTEHGNRAKREGDDGRGGEKGCQFPSFGGVPPQGAGWFKAAEQGHDDAPRKNGVTRRSVLLGVGILAISLVAQACITLFGTLHKGRSASITDSDGVVREMPLNTNGRAEVTTSLGTNIIEVADGQIRVVDATCTNKDCVHQSPISRPGQTIVCLPNRLVIRIEGSEDDNGTGNTGRGDTEGGEGSNGSGSNTGGSNTNENTPPDVDAVAG